MAVNEAATRALGYTEKELLSRSMPDLLATEERDRIATLLEESTDLSDMVSTRSSWRLVRRDGDLRRVQVAPKQVLFASQPSVILYEPPEGQESVADIDRSVKDLPEISFVALHDLKEPLHLVKGYLSLLHENAYETLDPDARDYLDQACHGADRLQTVVLDMLEYLRVGARPLTMEPIELEAVWNEVQERLRLTIENSGAEITNDPLPCVMAERTHMERLLENLLSNGLKFVVERTPRIHLGVAHTDKGWEFRFQDNGIGIEKNDLERVLEPFQRVHSSDRFPGTGLGLPITRKILDLHGGDLEIDSEPGVGTIVRFTLPDDREVRP